MATGIDRERLEALLRNEVDLAFRWRVRSAFAHLDPQSDDEVLDCACGLGYHSMALSKLVPCEVVGLDRDAERLLFAKRQVSETAVRFCLGDMYHLPFKDRWLDKILLVEVLEHLDDDLAGLREVWRILKPGGTVALTVPYRNYPFLYDPVNWVLERLAHHPIRRGPFAGIWTEHCRLYGRDDLLALVEEAGFEVIDCEMLTHYCFPFTHNLVYEVGKRVLLQRRLPGFLLNAVDRFHPEAGSRSPWNPVTWVMRILVWIDSFNKRSMNKTSFVNISMKARKRHD